MQLTLVQFGAISAGALVALGRSVESVPDSVKGEELKPIVIDLSEDKAQKGMPGILHSTAEFLIISISGCAPKR
jgi:hypothetical protein